MSNETPQGTDVFQILQTTRAMRRLKPDPVPDELIRQVLEAGVCAPNGSNSQSWGFIVCTDSEIKRQVQHYYQRAFDEYILPNYESRRDQPPAGMSVEQFSAQIERVTHLTQHFHDAPVWIVACLDHGKQRLSYLTGASIYPAVQNMLLAARALGLGATLTTRHGLFAKEVDALFGLPETVRSYAILPLGYPVGRFGPVRRGPLNEVVFRDTWHQPWLEQSESASD